MFRTFRLILFLLFLLPLGAWAQQVSTFGTEFWVTFISNWLDNDVDQYTISISGSRNCTAVVANPNSGWSQTVSVQVGQVATLSIPPVQCWQAGSCIVSDRGLHVTATDTVCVSTYSQSGTMASCDANRILPVQSLGSEYVVSTYPMYSDQTTNFQEFCVLAMEDGETVRIILGGPTSTGFQAGDTITVQLNAGQVYRVRGPMTYGDFTGTRITETGCRPIAVYSGSSVAQVPPHTMLAWDYSACQLWPINMTARKWVLTPEAWHNDGYARITALDTRCTVSVNSQVRQLLAPHESVDIRVNQACVVTTSQPVLIHQYLTNRAVGNQGGDYGDAAMFAPDPDVMRCRDVTFDVYTAYSRQSCQSKYYVNVVVLASERTLLRLDGSPVTCIAVPGSSTYYYACLMISAGTHRLSTTGSGFTAYVCGLGENWEGYAYNLGGTDTTGAVWIPDTHRDTIAVDECGDSYRYLGETYVTSGVYPLLQTCDSASYLSLALHPEYEQGVDTASCDSLMSWGNTTLVAPGEYRLQYLSEYGCDSIVQLTLGRSPSYSFQIDTDACNGLFEWQDALLSVPGTYEIRLATQAGCDSIYNITLVGHPTYDTTYYATISDAESYTWVDGQTYTNATDTALYLQSRYGCDSIIRHVLSVMPSKCPPEVWVPNVFTPHAEPNRVFRVVSQHVDKMTVTIYDRQGDRVCTFDGLAEGWDGTHDGVICQQAAYVYRIDYESSYTKEVLPPIVGTVLLVRRKCCQVERT